MCRNLLERDLVDRLQITAKFILLLSLFCTQSCDKGLKSLPSEQLNSGPGDSLGFVRLGQELAEELRSD
jgi:hypothetical protein